MVNFYPIRRDLTETQGPTFSAAIIDEETGLGWVAMEWSEKIKQSNRFKVCKCTSMPGGDLRTLPRCLHTWNPEVPESHVHRTLWVSFVGRGLERKKQRDSESEHSANLTPSLISKQLQYSIFFIISFSAFLISNASAQGVFSKIINEEKVLPDGKIYKEITYLQKSDPVAEVSDLTEQIEQICNKSKVLENGKIRVTVKYADASSKTVADLANRLLEVLGETRLMLQPLPVDDLVLYLLPIESIDFNFKIVLEKKGQTFYHLKPFKSEKDLSVDCSNGYSFGHNVYLDIPHELTHNSLSGIIDQTIQNDDYPRWFEEGLAEFVSLKVSSKLYPCWTEYRKSFTIPRVSLSRPEVFPDILGWDRENGLIKNWLGGEKDPSRVQWNELTLFGAAYQLIQNDFGADKEELARFLSILQGLRDKRRSKLKDKDLLREYKRFVGKSFGKNLKLGTDEEQTLVDSESDFLVQDYEDRLPNKNKLKRYRALSVLASTDLALKNDVLTVLIARKGELEKTSTTDLDQTFLDLINTALAVRLRDMRFRERLKEALGNYESFKNSNPDSIFRSLSSRSNRSANW